ncbi:hypothetical protein OF83DRAFT_1085003 [Amylostereum chailletii]|nr:hypothetical protein OF83DRAFT_1085003 [Amylostereum chailletii]
MAQSEDTAHPVRNAPPAEPNPIAPDQNDAIAVNARTTERQIFQGIDFEWRSRYDGVMVPMPRSPLDRGFMEDLPRTWQWQWLKVQTKNIPERDEGIRVGLTKLETRGFWDTILPEETTPEGGRILWMEEHREGYFEGPEWNWKENSVADVILHPTPDRVFIFTYPQD